MILCVGVRTRPHSLPSQDLVCMSDVLSCFFCCPCCPCLLCRIPFFFFYFNENKKIRWINKKSHAGATTWTTVLCHREREKVIGPLTPSNSPFLFVLCSSSFILFCHYFSVCYFHKPSYHTHTSAALYALINPAYSSAFFFTSTFSAYIHILSFPLPPTFLSFGRPLHFSTFHFIPISLCCVYVCVCLRVCGSWALVVIFQAAAQKIGLS